MLTSSQYSVSGYECLLRGIQDAGYQFSFFDEVGSTSSRSRACLLRHDVDVDVGAALRLAEIEARMGVRSTYFLMLRSPVYNLMARHNHRAVCEIQGMGHALALHYDAGFVVAANSSHESCISQEADWLERQYGVAVKAVSFHQPGPDVLSGQVKTGKRINTYDKRALADFTYFSDSNRALRLSAGGWASSDATTDLRNLSGQNIQLLIHPMWWIYDSSSTENVWDQAMANNFYMEQQQMLATERAYGHKRDIHFKRLSDE